MFINSALTISRLGDRRIVMCNHYRQVILRGERIPGWSIDQFSGIGIGVGWRQGALQFPR